MSDPIVYQTEPPFPSTTERLEAARAYAAWHIGHPDWADSIIDAYMHPERALEELAADKEDNES